MSIIISKEKDNKEAALNETNGGDWPTFTRSISAKSKERTDWEENRFFLRCDSALRGFIQLYVLS